MSKLSENIKLNLDKIGMTWEDFYSFMENNSNYWRTRRYNHETVSDVDYKKMEILFEMPVETIISWSVTEEDLKKWVEKRAGLFG